MSSSPFSGEFGPSYQNPEDAEKERRIAAIFVKASTDPDSLTSEERGQLQELYEKRPDIFVLDGDEE